MAAKKDQRILEWDPTGPVLFSVGEKLCNQKELVLWQGKYGSVYRAFWQGKDSKENEVAVRKLKVNDCRDDWKDIVDQHLKETLNHENVLKILAFVEDADKWRYFVLESYSATLEQVCNGQYRGTMPSDAKVLYQIARGINYLHKRRLAHGNLNPQTILISQIQPVRIKVAEFGLCKFIDCQKQQDDEQSGPQTHGRNTLSTIFRRAFNSESLDDNLAPLSHPKYWMKTKFESLPIDKDGNRLVPRATVNGDVFSAGCLFFYYIKRGLHPFGDTKSILTNISRKNPINLQELKKQHFAFDFIKDMIGDPSADGRNFLMEAAAELKRILPLNIDINVEYGRGGYGMVFGGTYEGNRVAVKRIPVAIIGDSEDHKREVELHKGLEHDNVLKLLHVDEEIDNTYRYLVLEFCAGTLTNYCENKYCGPALPSDEFVLFQIALGLDYIHLKQLVHRDVKPDNILISATTPVQIKLSDFGLCKKVSPQGTFSQSGLKGTLNWMAQEQLEILSDPYNIPDDLPHGTIESDTFAAGCVFFYFLTRGSHPFGTSTVVLTNICSDNPVTFRSNLKKLEEQDHHGQNLYNLIGKMIKKKEERIMLTEVVRQLVALLPASKFKRQFKSIAMSVPQISGLCLSRFHPTDSVLACGSDSSTVFLLKGANGSIPFSNWRIEQEFKGKTQERIKELEWNVNGTQLAAEYWDGTIIVWSYPSGRVLFEEKKHPYKVNLIAWNPFRKDVLATRNGNDWNWKELLFWNTRENGDAGKANHFLTLECIEEITSVAWISANQIAIGLENGEIEIWEIDEDKGTSRVVKRFRHSEQNWITWLQWNEKTKYLAACSWDKWMKIWSMDSDQPIYSLEVHSRCCSLDLRANVKTDSEGGIDVERTDKENFAFACGLQDGSIVIWNPLEENEENRKGILPQKHLDEVLSLSFSSDGRFLASRGDGGELIIWSTETWLPVFTCQNDRWELSWMSTTNSSSVPAYKLAVISLNKVLVVEQSVTE